MTLASKCIHNLPPHLSTLPTLHNRNTALTSPLKRVLLFLLTFQVNLNLLCFIRMSTHQGQCVCHCWTRRRTGVPRSQ